MKEINVTILTDPSSVMKLYLEIPSLLFKLRSVKPFSISHLQLAVIEPSTVESIVDFVEESDKLRRLLTRSLLRRDEPMFIQQNTSSIFTEK